MADFLKNPMGGERFITTDRSELFEAAKVGWNARVSTLLAVVRLQRWCLVAVSASLVASMGANFWQYSSAPFSAFLVREERSEIVDLRGPWTPSDGAKRDRLANLIDKWRSRPLDPVIYSRNQKDVAAWISRDVADKFSADYQATQKAISERKAVGCNAISVEIIAVQPLSDGLMQIRWSEACFGNGTRLQTHFFTGTGRLDAAPPRRLDDLKANPLGLILTDFYWTQDYAQK